MTLTVKIVSVKQISVSSFSIALQVKDNTCSLWQNPHSEHLSAPIMASFFISSNKEALCEGCRGINIESLCTTSGYIHTVSISGSGPYKSCPLCDLIANYPRPERERAILGCQSSLRASYDGYLEICAIGTGVEAPNYVSNIFVRTRKGSSLFLLCVSLMFRSPPKGDPASVYGLPIVVDLTNTASEESLQQAQNWIQNCASDHDRGKALQFPDVEPAEDTEQTRSAQSADASSQAASSEHIIENKTLVRNNDKLMKGYRKQSLFRRKEKIFPPAERWMIVGIQKQLQAW